jgi:hypothetical protein
MTFSIKNNEHNNAQENGTQHKDTQHNNTRENGTQHKDTKHNAIQLKNTQQNNKSNTVLRIIALGIMLPIAVMLSVIYFERNLY